MDQKDIGVEVTQDSVRIAGEKKVEEKKEEKGCYHRETSYGAFERIVDLPAAVNEEKAEAEFSNGVLTIKLPRSEQARFKRKKVEVRSAQAPAKRTGSGPQSEPSSLSRHCHPAGVTRWISDPTPTS